MTSSLKALWSHHGDASRTRKSLAERLRTAGCSVDTSGTDWLSAGDLTPPPLPGGGLPLGKRVPTEDRRGPSLNGHWMSGTGKKLDQIKVTNNGAVPLFEVKLVVPDELQEHVTLIDHQPVAKLPAGKTFTVMAMGGRRTFAASQAPGQFELVATGKLDDGRASAKTFTSMWADGGHPDQPAPRS